MLRLPRRRAALAVLLVLTLSLAALAGGTAGRAGTSRALLAAPGPAPAEIVVLQADGSEQRWALEDYLVGVVAAEMPAGFAPAALQAQAMAARTYTLRHSAPFGTPRHGTAAVCTDSTCCQAWADEATLRQRWGDAYPLYRQKIAAAVSATAGEILCYEGAPIDAVYCACCGGRTAAAAAVWGRDVPYLQAVACPYCRNAPGRSACRQLPLTEIAALLQVTAATPLTLAQFDGVTLRRQLALASADVAWLICDDRVAFYTLGHGHRVGLCQYGADGMAAAGYDYRQILQYYYTNCTIQNAG